MLRRSFDSILDECLAALQQGERLEDCLARYPKHAARLRPLLTLGQRIGRTPRARPRASAQSLAWAQFRQRAQDMRLARPRAASRAWMRPLAVAASLLLLFLAAGGGTVYASQSSLPDSPLYRVKLASEEVRLWFTFDDTAKAEVLLDQSEERVQEIKEMLQKRKTIPGIVLSALHNRNTRAMDILEKHPEELALARRAEEQIAAQEELLLAIWEEIKPSAREKYAETVAGLHNARLRALAFTGEPFSPEDLAGGVLHISGPAEPSTGGIWRFGGVEVRVDDRTLGARDLEPGRVARLVAARGANGRLHALTLSIADVGSPQPAMVVSGALEQVSDREITIGGQRITITRDTLLRLKLNPGQRVEITLSDVEGQAVASVVEPASGEEGDQGAAFLAYEGTIEGKVSTDAQFNDWRVSGQTFTITPATVIDAQARTLEEGAQVRIEALNRNGRLLARRVIVLAAAPQEGFVRVEGLFQGKQGGRWLVSGLQVTPPKGIEAPPANSLVSIAGERKGSHILAREVIVVAEADSSRVVQVQGPINRIEEGGIWHVGIAPVLVGDDAQVVGTPAVGARALIWGQHQGPGPLRALYVNVLDNLGQR